MKKVVIVGGSGFLGTSLVEELLKRNYQVVVIDYNKPKNSRAHFVDARTFNPRDPDPILMEPYGYINLAGKSIFGRWNKKFKAAIYYSRINTTDNLVKLFMYASYKPEVMVQASAVGFYGVSKNEDSDLDEYSIQGDTFLAQVADDWEETARKVVSLGVRLSIMRNGHILGQGGLLGVLIPQFKWFMGGTLASGSQLMPWIHIDDCVNLYLAALESETSEIINAVAPEIISNKEFSTVLARELKRPLLFLYPKFLLAMRFGEFAYEMTISQKVKSRNMPQGFYFKYPQFKDAMHEIVQSRKDQKKKQKEARKNKK